MSNDSRPIYIALAVLGLIILIIASVFLFVKKQQNPVDILGNQSQDTLFGQAGSNKEVILQSLAKVYSVPPFEIPQMEELTILNIGQTKNNPFFAGAQVSDWFIVYGKSGKAILFRPIENKVINSGPIQAKQNQQRILPQQEAPTPTITPVSGIGIGPEEDAGTNQPSGGP